MAAIVATKAYRTAPTDALLVIAGLPPIQHVILSRYIKNLLIKLNTPNNNNTLTNRAINELKLPEAIHSIVKDVKEYGIDKMVETDTTHPAAIKSCNIYFNHLPPTKGVNFYTDGSKTENTVGAAVYLDDPSKRHYWQSVASLNNHCTINQAESLAILHSLKYIKTNIQHFKRTTINILSDSRTALHQLNKGNRQLPIINNCLQIIGEIGQVVSINLYWVRGHTGIYGNEKADALAKKAHTITSNCSYAAISLSVIKNKLNAVIMDKWQKEWDASTTGRLTHQFLPNISKRMTLNFFNINHAITQLLTAHGNFRAYLYRFLKKGSSTCNCGIEEDEDPYHVIFTCANHRAHRPPLRDRLQAEGHHWPCTLEALLHNKKIFSTFKAFVAKLRLADYHRNNTHMN
ncbi:uncharacterized protein LOC111641340 [Centruroides sculpturatus]|uniref:uncharacterized protein LOC111641340 n=1 Tax=Centruroides sculpturatus TaxID=218467 RepID=UPI000C6C9A41|nr:uncharacterized protein LOC111641340 [Centruroides sculpturatus]